MFKRQLGNDGCHVYQKYTSTCRIKWQLPVSDVVDRIGIELTHTHYIQLPTRVFYAYH